MAVKLQKNKGTHAATGKDPDGNDVEVFKYPDHVAVRAKGDKDEHNIQTAGSLEALRKEGYVFEGDEALAQAGKGSKKK